MSLWDKFRRTPPAAMPRCALCGLDSNELRFLLSGEAGFVCDGCVPHAMLALMEKTPVFLALASELPRTTPLTRSGPILSAAIAWARDAAELRRVVPVANGLGHAAAIREAVGAIPEAERRFDDRVSLAVAAALDERREEGLEVLASVDVTALEAIDVAFVEVNRAALHALDAADATHRERAAASVRAAEEALARAPDSLHRTGCLGSLSGTRAVLALARGDFAAALRHLEVPGRESDRPFQMWRGDALAGLGDRERARALHREALENVPPDSKLAEQLRRRLAADAHQGGGAHP